TRMASDPHSYRRLSERLEEILQHMEDDHDFGQAYLELVGLRAQTLVEEEATSELGLDRWTEKPIHSLLEEVVSNRPGLAHLDIVTAARGLAGQISVEVLRPHFLYNGHVRETARKRLIQTLVVNTRLVPVDAQHIADKLVDLATSNRERFLRLSDR